MPQDENTYGFSKNDAGELVQLIGGIDREYIEGRVRGSISMDSAAMPSA